MQSAERLSHPPGPCRPPPALARAPTLLPSSLTHPPPRLASSLPQAVAGVPRLFVGQLPPGVTEAELLPVFSPYGAVEKVTLVRGPDAKSRGCAMVQYGRWAAAEAAAEALDGAAPFGAAPRGRPIVVHFANPRRAGAAAAGPPEAAIAPRKLFVGQVPRGATEAALRAVFAAHGEVESVNLLESKGARAGCAFVQYARWASCEAAIAALHERAALPGGEHALVVKFADAKRAEAPLDGAAGAAPASAAGAAAAPKLTYAPPTHSARGAPADARGGWPGASAYAPPYAAFVPAPLGGYVDLSHLAHVHPAHAAALGLHHPHAPPALAHLPHGLPLGAPGAAAYAAAGGGRGGGARRRARGSLGSAPGGSSDSLAGASGASSEVAEGRALAPLPSGVTPVAVLAGEMGPSPATSATTSTAGDGSVTGGGSGGGGRRSAHATSAPPPLAAAPYAVNARALAAMHAHAAAAAAAGHPHAHFHPAHAAALAAAHAHAHAVALGHAHPHAHRRHLGAPPGGKVGRGVADPAAYAHKLFVGQVPLEATEADLWPLVAPLGEVLELAVLRAGGRSKGCAFLTLATREQAAGAIAALDGRPVAPGRKLVVKFADQKAADQKAAPVGAAPPPAAC